MMLPAAPRFLPGGRRPENRCIFVVYIYQSFVYLVTAHCTLVSMVRYVQYLVQGKVSQGVTPTVSLAAALLIFVGVGVFAVAIAQVSSHWWIHP